MPILATRAKCKAAAIDNLLKPENEKAQAHVRT